MAWHICAALINTMQALCPAPPLSSNQACCHSCLSPAPILCHPLNHLQLRGRAHLPPAAQEDQHAQQGSRPGPQGPPAQAGQCSGARRAGARGRGHNGSARAHGRRPRCLPRGQGEPAAAAGGQPAGGGAGIVTAPRFESAVHRLWRQLERQRSVRRPGRLSAAYPPALGADSLSSTRRPRPGPCRRLRSRRPLPLRLLRCSSPCRRTSRAPCCSFPPRRCVDWCTLARSGRRCRVVWVRAAE